MSGKLLLILLIAVSLFSCTTAKKAKRFFNEHPEVAAEYCADAFPVQESTDTVRITDSAQYLKDKEYIDSLLVEIADRGDSIVEVVRVDTNCKHYAPVIRKLQADNKALRYALENQAPIYDTVIIETVKESLARVVDLQNKLKAAIEERDKWRVEFVDMKESRNQYRLMWWIVLALLGIGIFLKIKKVL